MYTNFCLLLVDYGRLGYQQDFQHNQSLTNKAQKKAGFVLSFLTGKIELVKSVTSYRAATEQIASAARLDRTDRVVPNTR
jgi:hypothetical protein